MQTCAVPNCIAKQKTLIYCGKHYQRYLRHGDVNFTKRPKKSDQKVCQLKNCNRNYKAKGYCDYHYNKYFYRKTDKFKTSIKKWYKKWYQTEKGRKCLDNQVKKRKQRIKTQTPKWANLDAIKQFYLNCPKGYVVDHIVPLAGKIVSGLHVENNLQYLTKKANSQKWNLVDWEVLTDQQAL